MSQQVSVQVVLRHAHDQREAEELFAALRDSGFRVGPVVGNNFSLTGDIESMTRLFAGDTPESSSRRSADPANLVDSSATGELPRDRLMEKWENIVDSVVMPQTPDFGPGNP